MSMDDDMDLGAFDELVSLDDDGMTLEEGELSLPVPVALGPSSQALREGHATDDEFDDLMDLPEIASGEMRQTDFGAHPWGPGSGVGYRPMSMARTDSAPLGSTDDEGRDKEQRMLEATGVLPGEAASASYAQPRRPTPQQQAHPDVDALTLYDRSSYEPHDADGWVEPVTVGAGIFDMPEGATFRPDQGIFAHHYALPRYLGEEPETAPYASAAIDLNTGLPRVMQPSAAGVQLAMQVDGPGWDSPFSPPPYGQVSPMRAQPGVPGPRNAFLGAAPAPQGTRRIEVFGGRAAAIMLREAQARCQSPEMRGQFLCNALDYLGPERSLCAMRAIKRLSAMGYDPNTLTHHVLAHMIMHQSCADLRATGARGRDPMPGMTRLAQAMGSVELAEATREFVAPLTESPAQVEVEVTQFTESESGQRADEIVSDGSAAPSSKKKYLAWGVGAGLAALALYGWQQGAK